MRDAPISINEIPYDPPDQVSYSSGVDGQGRRIDGWAAYKVSDQGDHARGLGSRHLFGLSPSQRRAHAAPSKCRRVPGVRFHHMITVALDNLGEISNVIDDAGGATATRPRSTPKLAEFP